MPPEQEGGHLRAGRGQLATGPLQYWPGGGRSCSLPEALHDPAIYREYFQPLSSDVEVNKRQEQRYRQDLNYPEVTRWNRLIVEDTVPVVVPYKDAEVRLAQ
jgi:hypothetical protein